MLSRRTFTAAIAGLGFGRASWAQAPAGDAPLVGAFEVTRNRPWTHVHIQGQGPFRFLIDTGATVSVIDPDLAARLSLPRLEDAQLQGATAERTVEMFSGREVIVAEALRQRGAVAFASGRPGADFDGILPGAMFAAAPSELDFSAKEFRIYPRGAPDRRGFERLPLIQGGPGGGGGRWVVRVRLDDEPVDLLVDTGGTGSVLLSGEYVGKNGLWNRYRKWAPSQGQGIMTAFNMRLARARSLELGPSRFDRPLVHLTDPFNPPGDGGDGVLGMDLLRRFTLSTDPVGKALWLKPNAAVHEPFRYNRAGLEAAMDPRGCAVRTVVKGGPAEKAGVRVDDLIRAVESPRDLAQFDWRMTAKPGERVAIELVRGGGIVPATIVLRELL